jgi:23S rRNA (pseudouridine1915-N3)-methyltransferase
MMSVHLICVGKLKEKFYLAAAEEYLKRLKGYCKLELVELPEVKLPQDPTLGEIQAALDKEGAAIRAKIPAGSSIVAMCVEGKLQSSEELAATFRAWEMNSAKHLVFVIGGSYGLHPSIKKEAWLRLSMSPMTFPHHLARVMVLEQIYRAFKINEGSSYHK